MPSAKQKYGAESPTFKTANPSLGLARNPQRSLGTVGGGPRFPLKGSFKGDIGPYRARHYI